MNNWDEDKSETLLRIKYFKINLMTELLDKCTSREKEIFYKMYPEIKMDVYKFDKEKYNWAIIQLENTIRENGQQTKEKESESP